MFNVNHIIIDIVLVILIFLCTFIIATGCVIGIQELTTNSFNQPDLNFAEAFYYVLITTTTLGYGDIYPTNIYSRFLIIILILCFISIVSNQITWLISILQLWGNYITYSFQNHIILLIDNSINLFEVLSEIKKNNHGQEVIIISNDILRLPSKEFPYNKVFIINSNTIDLEILERANVKYANCIFVFTNKGFESTDKTEKVIEFIVLKIHQYYNHIPIYVQTLINEKAFSSGNYLQKEHFLLNPKKQESAIKGIVPLIQIKNLIESKALFNPGYANFIQNLLFNDIEIPDDLDHYEITMQGYFLGCQNKIQIRKLPSYFIGHDFYDVVRVIYTKSIKDYLVKVMLRDIKDVNRPILLIGVTESHGSDMVFFPKEHTIIGGCDGIFITYDEKGYLDDILATFKGKMNKVESVRLRKEKTMRLNAIKEEEEEDDDDEILSDNSWSNNNKKKSNSNDDSDNNDNQERKFERRKGIIIKPKITQYVQNNIDNQIGFNNDNDYIDDDLTQIQNSSENILKDLNQIVQQQTRVNEFNTESLPVHDTETNDNEMQLCKMSTNLLMSNNNMIINTQQDQDDSYLTQKNNKPNYSNDQQISTLKDELLINKPILLSSTNYKRPTKSKESNHKVQVRTKYKDKDQSSNDEIFDIEEKQIRDTKLKDKEYFISRKNLMITGNIYQDKSTTKNLLFLHSIDDSGLDSIQQEILNHTDKRYEALDILDNEELLYNNRIIDCTTKQLGKKFDNHIILFGYQDGIEKLISHIRLAYANNKLCIFVDNTSNDELIYKLLKKFKTLYLLHGSIDNPLHLINAGLSRAKYALFLINSSTNKSQEDMGNILSFKIIDNFFQTNILLELWIHQSTIFVGYKPIEAKLFHNEFSHPLYLSGKLVYLDHLDRIIVMSKKNKKAIEAWMQLLQLGQSSTISSINATLIYNRHKDKTITITLDIPSFYHGKEFYYLFTDLLCQRNPIMVLGLYIENPLEYLRLRSEGRINKFTRKFTSDIRISTSYRRHNMSERGAFDQGMLAFLRLAKKYSINDKIVMDYVDMKHPFMPIFVTNPPPWFIISKNTKMLVLYTYQTENCGIESFQKQYQRRKKNNMSNSKKQNIKEILFKRQENFVHTIKTFKDKVQENYEKAIKIVDSRFKIE